MSTFSTRSAFVPVWLLVFGVAVFAWSPLTLATALLLLVVGVVVPTVALKLWRPPSITVAEVLHDAETTNAAIAGTPEVSTMAAANRNPRG